MYANFVDVRDAYEEPLTTDRTGWVEAKLASAEIRLAAVVGDLSLKDPDVVREVIVSAVLRVVRMPTGTTQESETIGSWAHSTTVDPRVGSGSIWFTTEDLALLGVGGTAFGTAHVRVPGCYR